MEGGPACRRAYICDSCRHVSSTGSIYTVPILTLRLSQPPVDVIDGALAANEPLKVLFHLQGRQQMPGHRQRA